MKFVSGRQAFMDMAGIRSCGDQLLGGFLANDINDRFHRFKINVTYVKSEAIGHCQDGSYSGSYAKIHANESDWFETSLTNPDCDLLPGKFGPFLSAFENSIFYLRENDNSTAKPLTMLKAATPDVYIIFVLAVILIQQLLSRTRGLKSKKRWKRRVNEFGIWRCLFLMLALFSRQLSDQIHRLRSMGRRQLFLAYIFLSFFVFTFFMNFYGTSLIIREPVETLDSLEELANSKNHTASFPEAFNLWQKFERSTEFPLQTIWQRTMKKVNNDKSKILLSLMHIRIDQLIDSHTVNILIRPMAKYLLKYFCRELRGWEPFDKYTALIGRRVEVEPEQLILVTRTDIDPDLRDRLHKLYVSYSELGYDIFFQEYSYILKDEEVDVTKCKRKAYDRSFKTRTRQVDTGGNSYSTLR